MGGALPAADELCSDAGEIFGVMAWEIELAGARCIFLDKMIGELMHSVPPSQREKLVEGMHMVDLLAQHLTSLSSFARQVSADLPGGAYRTGVDAALAQITLGDLADRMRTSLGGHEIAGTADVESGDMDLF
jgi:hypothetical protein